MNGCHVACEVGTLRKLGFCCIREAYAEIPLTWVLSLWSMLRAVMKIHL